MLVLHAALQATTAHMLCNTLFLLLHLQLSAVTATMFSARARSP